MFQSNIKPPAGQKNVSVAVTMLAAAEQQVELLFRLILDDYTKRFGLKIKGNWHVGIALIDWTKDNMPVCPDGITVVGEGQRIMIQVADPYMDGELEPNFYTDITFLEVMCHEMVHACQYITGREGIKLKIKHDRENEQEAYYFDPGEVEARVFQSIYTAKFATTVMSFPAQTPEDVGVTPEGPNG